MQSGRIVYTQVRKSQIMGTLKVGIREFREKLATYLLIRQWQSHAMATPSDTTFQPGANAVSQNVQR